MLNTGTDRQYEYHLKQQKKTAFLSLMSRKEQKHEYALIPGATLSPHENEKDGEIFQLILNTIPQYVFWKDRNSVYQGCNRKFCDAAGLGSPEEIQGLTDHDLPWTREEADFYVMCDQRVMENDQPEYNIIESQVQADNCQYWLRTNKIPLHGEDGEVIGILGTFDDVTDLLKQEERLKHYEIITATVDDLMAIIDTEYRYQAVNDAYCVAYAQSRKNIIGSSVPDIVGQDVFDDILKSRMDRSLQGEVVEFTSWRSFAGWGEKHIDYTYYPVFTDAGTVSRWQIHRQALGAERAPDIVIECLEIGSLGIDLIDDNHPTAAFFARRLHHAPGDHLDPFFRVDHNSGRLDSGKHRKGSWIKVAVPRCVDQVNVNSTVVEVAN